VITRLKGVLTKAEHGLVKSERSSRGRDLIKQVKIELVENGRGILESAIKAITKRKIISIHTDLSTGTGERVIIFILDRPPYLSEAEQYP
ncbi:MAG: DUF2294 family protein, partial [Chitinivibrionales bacterium]|nr:DUF2294 family protein [Chitinivibrionales bacterium]MBD3356815.1 DUF2294 family protein [Chitinivibrionales bacterium]